MIHNTFLMRISSKEILASSQYWPVEVTAESLEEFIETREELRSDDISLANLPLSIDDDKFVGADVVKDLVLIFVSDVGEQEHTLIEHLDSAAKILKSRIQRDGLEYVIDHYESLIEDSITTRLKIALVGEGGTGKTTTLHLLLGDTPPLQYVPTIALNLETVENIRFGNYSLVLWDFAGQERFRNLWRFYFHGADVIFLVCDSTLRNVIISKDILKLIKRDAPKVPVFALANKQDKPNAMKPEVVQKILGVPTYPMVAIDKSRRDEMLRILMNAAAQYVGVALPDLPPQELLRFTDEATESAAEAIEKGELYEEDDGYEEMEIIEEVYMDEEGHIVEATDDYVVVEEVVEVVEDEEVAEPEAVAQEATVESPKAMVDEEWAVETTSQGGDRSEEIMIEAAEPDEIALEVEAVEEQEEEWEIEPISIEAPMPKQIPVETLESEEIVTEETEAEWEIEPAPSEEGPPARISVEVSEPEATDLEAEKSLGMPSFEQEEREAIPADSDTSVLAEEALGSDEDGLETTDKEDEMIDGSQMARELISEALGADDIVSEEIERASKEDLDTALEAFSSDEVLPPDEESETDSEVDDEAIREIYGILGSEEEDLAHVTETEEDEDEEADIDEQLAELDEMFTMLDFESSE
ncbi:GTP-binding protein [Candidatus Thorarchaeota archaeon]|nr:MAG: GTP-binding protein [Candidatus Thorarchaeota archaeon]